MLAAPAIHVIVCVTMLTQWCLTSNSKHWFTISFGRRCRKSDARSVVWSRCFAWTTCMMALPGLVSCSVSAHTWKNGAFWLLSNENVLMLHPKAVMKLFPTIMTSWKNSLFDQSIVWPVLKFWLSMTATVQPHPDRHLTHGAKCDSWSNPPTFLPGFMLVGSTFLYMLGLHR